MADSLGEDNASGGVDWTQAFCEGWAGMKIPINCEVCQMEFMVEPYDKGTCPNCGLLHEYEEDWRPVFGEVVGVNIAKGEVTLRITRGT